MLFNYIIPVANTGERDFEDRLVNLRLILNQYPKSDVQMVLVEQVVNKSLPTFGDKLRLGKDVAYIQVINPVFNKGWLYNLGVKASKSDDVILGESDCTPNTPNAYFHKLHETMTIMKRQWAFAWNKLIYLAPDGKSVQKVVSPKEGFAEGGIVYFKKKYYNRIGGANEFMRELGGIDNELAKRASFFQSRYSFNWTLVHHWHNQNTMKSNDWQYAEYRTMNRKIYFEVCAKGSKVVGKLNSVKRAGPRPLCDKMNWKTVVL